MTITGPDVSHHQGAVDFAAVARAGHDFAVVKATEGVGYSDPQFTAYRAKAHAAGLVVGLYHFARAGDPGTEAAYFLRTVGDLRPGEFLVLDWEVPGANPPGWCLAWLNAVRSSTGVKPLLYMNSTAVNGSNWSLAVAADYGLWLAKYDNQTQTPVQFWGVPAMKQFTDRATVPGVAGPCDLNVFYGTPDQLLAYCKGGTTPGGDLSMADAQSILDFLQNTTGADLRLINGKVDRVVSAVVAGDGAGPQNNFAWLYDQLAPRLDAQAAALASLAGLVAQGHADLTKDDILATVDKAIRDATVNVDVNVNHPT